MMEVAGVLKCAARSFAALLGACLGMAALAQGTAYVSSEKDQAVTLIDLATLSVKGTIPTCKRGRHIQLMPDHQSLGSTSRWRRAEPARGTGCSIDSACRRR